MAQRRIGDILRERREQLRLTIDQAADSTNIRARMLETFEESDYEHFPARGYTQGMFSSYARYLKLDPHKVVEGINAELDAFEDREEMHKVARAARIGLGLHGGRRSSEHGRPAPRSSGSRRAGRVRPADEPEASMVMDYPEQPRPEITSVRNVRRVNRSRPGRASSYSRSHDRYGHRVESVDRSRERIVSSETELPASQAIQAADDGGRMDVAAARQRGTRAGTSSSDRRDRSFRLSSTSTGRLRTTRVQSEEDASYAAEGLEPDYELRGNRKQHPVVRSADGTSAGRSRSSRDLPLPVNQNIFERLLSMLIEIFKDRRSRMIAIAVILIVIAILVAASILVSTAGNGGGGVIEVEGGAQNSTTTTTTNPNTATATVTVADGNPLSISIDVASGQTSLINVTYDDDNAYNGTAVGPWHREFQVTDSFSATFGTPGAVTVSENGNPIAIQTQSDGTGVLNLSVKSSSAGLTDSTSTKSSSSSSNSNSTDKTD